MVRSLRRLYCYTAPAGKRSLLSIALLVLVFCSLHPAMAASSPRSPATSALSATRPQYSIDRVMTGTLTIGASGCDYTTFTAAIADLQTFGVQPGGVTFLVNPGNYPEFVNVTPFTGMGSGNPVVFRANGGTVTVNPTPTSSSFNVAINLIGCQYVTFDGINVNDPSTGSFFLNDGYRLTNQTATLGAQHNTIKNATILMRKISTSAGVEQTPLTTPTSAEGAQSYNTYLNLKISKVLCGLYAIGNPTYPDLNTEIGSDSVGLNYSKRFTIGAMPNDTIGRYGIVCAGQIGLTIHDCDISRIRNTSNTIYGIQLQQANLQSNENCVIKNNRIYDLLLTSSGNFYNVVGIYHDANNTNASVKYINNMIYGLQSTTTGNQNTPNYAVYGIYSAQKATFSHNTIWLDQGSGNALNCSSTCIYLSSGSQNDTIRNNIFVNTTANQTGNQRHNGLTINFTSTTYRSDYNLIYVPITASGNAVYDLYNSIAYSTLSGWQATGKDTHSLSGDPQFISTSTPYDVHILPYLAALSYRTGTPIAEVTTDIDGHTRNAATPDLGADEFTALPGLTGTKTIGATGCDYPTFAAAITDLTNRTVGAGGVTFNVSSGNYPEFVTVPRISGMGSGSPVTFRANGGTVTVNPTPTGAGTEVGIAFRGCQYVTFEGINVTDPSTGSYWLGDGYRVTNSSATTGSQNITIKNATITLRKDFQSYGIRQNCSFTPTSSAGAQSNNRYFNLKISKCYSGLYLDANSSYPDLNTEIGSDSAGLNYTNRFTIGALANDTIAYAGIYANSVSGLSIHDIDVRNVTSFSGTHAYGIYLIHPVASGTVRVSNNRINNIAAIGTTAFFRPVGIYQNNDNNAPCYYYNNFVYSLSSIAPSAPVTVDLMITGFYSLGGRCNLDNNTFLIDQGSGNSLQFCSADIYLYNQVQGADTLRNNVIANITGTQSGTVYHVGIYNSGVTSVYSNNNCFYIPSSGNGYIGDISGTNYASLTSWRTASGQDANSTASDPRFLVTTSPCDLHVQPYLTSPINGTGTAISYVTTDIDGDLRSSTTPDIGADEFTPLPGLTGTKTIGASGCDYTTFNAAITDLQNRTVGSGGVTFLVSPGIYSEFVTITPITGMGSANPVVFRANGGTVTVNPTPTTAGTQIAITLKGCRYVTFDGINVIDPSTGSFWLADAYRLTNLTTTQGAQHCTIKNSTMVMRKDFNSSGVEQSASYTPASAEGAESYNTYLNLKISKVASGMYMMGYSTYPDINTEIGSDSVGLTYSKRFTVGAMANDTITWVGIYCTSQIGLNIHDCDITRVRYTAGNIYGIQILQNNLTSSALSVVKNNRIYDMLSSTSGTFNLVYGIDHEGNNSNPSVRFINNMIYNLQSTTTSSMYTSTNSVVGIYSQQSAVIDHNTIWIDQGSDHALNCSSSAITLSNGSQNDTLRNNIIINTTANQTSSAKHRGITIGVTLTNFLADNNLYYVPNAANGSYVYISSGGTTYSTLSAWQATGRDAHSVTGDPRFISPSVPYDLHIQPYQTVPGNNAGTTSPYATTDIDGDLRNSTTPDIGADEFTALPTITGIKTIGAAGCDYPTFSAAISDMMNRSVGTGGVTFNVSSGTYNEHLFINPIPGVSATNPVIFQKASGTVEIACSGTSATSGSSDVIVYLNGCDYITFDGINVRDAGTSTSNYNEFGYYIHNYNSIDGATNLVLKNLSVSLNRADSNSIGIYQVCDTPTNATGTNSNNRYLNLKISDCQVGIELFSTSSSYWDNGNEIGSLSTSLTDTSRFTIGATGTNSIGGAADACGVSIWRQGTVNIHDCDISNIYSESGKAFGILMSGCSGTGEIKRNRIFNIYSASNAVNGMDILSGSTLTTKIYSNFIYNLNAISGLSATQNTYGIIVETGTTYIDHNSILMNTTNPNGWVSCVQILYSTNATFHNNIFYNKPAQGAASVNYTIDFDYRATLAASDNNLFYDGGYGLFAYYGVSGGNCGSLANWRSNTGNDANSRYGNPYFVADTGAIDLHVQPYRPQNTSNFGTPVSWVTTDIDGDSRNFSIPDIGADEYDLQTLTLTRPNGVEICHVGSADTILWSSTALSGNVQIQLNRNYPSGSWETIIANTANTGSYTWTVTTPESRVARIRLLSIANPLIGDTSDANFTVRQDSLNISRVGQFNTSVHAYETAVSGNYQYVATSTAGLRVVNIANPASPVEVGSYTSSGFQIQNLQVVGNYVYATDYYSGLYIFNISNPTSPQLVGTRTLEHPRGLAISGNYAYIADYSNLRIINISNPANPTQTQTFAIPGHGFDIAVQGNYAYVTTGGGGLRIVDISNPSLPSGVGYFNSTLSNGSILGIAVAGNQAYITDCSEDEKSFRVINISNPASPQLVTSTEIGVSGTSIYLARNYAYLCGDWGCRVIDLNVPTTLTTTGFYNEFTDAYQVTGNGIYAYVSDLTGVHILNTALANPLLSITAPNGSEQFTIGSNRNVTWNAYGFSSPVSISLDRNYPSGNWETIRANTDNTGSYAWTVTGSTTTTTARIRIISVDNPLIGDTSDVNFTIMGTLTLTRPVNMDWMTIGNADSICWTSSGVSGNIIIELNRNYPNGSWDTVSRSTSNIGSFNWIVSGPPTAHARARISSVNFPAVRDSSLWWSFIMPPYSSYLVWQSPLTGTATARIDVGTGSNMYAASVDQHFYYSTDNGANWTAGSTVFGSTPSAVHYFNGYIYVATTGSGIYRSNNGGVSFSQINIGLTDLTVNELAYNNGYLFAATRGGLNRSTNGGTTWFTLTSEAAATAALSPYDNKLWVVSGTGNTVYYSTNNGVSWTTANSGINSAPVVSFAFTPVAIYAGTSDGRIFVTTNGGTSWTQSLQVPGAGFYSGLGFNSNRIFFADWLGAGVFGSADNGTNWTAADSGIVSMLVFGLARSNDGSMLAATYAGIQKTNHVQDSYLTLSNNNGSDLLRYGVNDTIRWSGLGFTGNVSIQLNRNYPTSTWDTVAANVANTGSYIWNVNGASTTTARMRIASISTPTLADTSDANLAIVHPQLTVTAPNSVIILQRGGIDTIRWTASELTGNVRIEVNRNYPGGTWDSISTQPAGNGQYLWAITSLPTTTARIRISSLTFPDVVDLSDTNFTIFEGVFLTHPNGGEYLQIGITDTITWITGAITDSIRIELNRNYPTGSWDSITTVANTGNYLWRASNPATTTARIRLVSKITNNVLAQSAANFEIYHPLIYPNGGESFTLAMPDTIRWNFHNYTGNIYVQYTRNYPGSFSTISMSGAIPASRGYYVWTPTQYPTSTYRIRLYPISRPELSDTSDANFVVDSLPQLTLLTPNGDDNILVGVPDTIRWTTSYNSHISIYLYRNGVSGAEEAISNADTILTRSGMFVWTPTGPLSNRAFIRIVDNMIGVEDYSNSAFHIVNSKITVTRPNGFEPFVLGLLDTIRWTSVNVNDSLQIDVKRGNGAWDTIRTRIPNTGSFVWRVDGAAAGAAWIRIRSMADSTISDVSDSSFTIFYFNWANTYRTHNPNENPQQTWSPEIPYDASTSDRPPADIYFAAQSGSCVNPDSLGVHYVRSASDDISTSTVNREWDLTASNASFQNAQVTLRFTSADLPTGITDPTVPSAGVMAVRSEDEGNSWIYQPGGMCFVDGAAHNSSGSTTYQFFVTAVSRMARWKLINSGLNPVMTMPDSGRRCTIGTVDTIRWNSAIGGGSVKIELNRNFPSGNWETIITETPNNGMYLWTVPNSATTTARIRITSYWGNPNALYPTDCDTCNVNFLIVPSYSPKPTAPARLSAELNSNDMILNWSAVTTDTTGAALTPDGYRIYSSTTALAPWTLLATVGGSITTWTDTNIVASQYRFYQVRAYFGMSSSSSSTAGSGHIDDERVGTDGSTTGSVTRAKGGW